jgi:ATP-dependent DNA helicase RecG
MTGYIKLNSSVETVKGVGPKSAALFNKNGINTVFDLLLHFPVFYIDFSKISTELSTEQKKLYRLDIDKWSLSQRNRFRKRFSVLKVSGHVGNQPVEVVFFNQHYLENFFKTNKSAYIYGQFENANSAWSCNTPLIFAENDHPAVLPVYAPISSIKTGKLKKMMLAALTDLNDDYEFLPAPCLDDHGFPAIPSALENIHFPTKYNPDAIEFQKKRFIYTEFLLFQLELQFIRNYFKRVRRHHRYSLPPSFLETVRQSLDFQLTPDQEAAVGDIFADLTGEVAMQRLLQGDVGSGKTIVAFIALLAAASNNYQGAFLAPTEILAAQHFANAKKFFSSLSIELLTGSTTAKKRKEILKGLKEGTIDIIFGTHALITESVLFKHLALVVIDEQHRFGVSQRAALYYKGKAVDLLVTTATPIPRTMLLSLYNDLSVSLIKTSPPGRLPIITKIIRNSNRNDFYQGLRNKIDSGEKAYIILPLIEQSDFFTELKDIETESTFYKKIFKGIPIGIVTGRTPAAKKDDTLNALASGDIRVLIATTVIEVGIDVKDASYIVIENADRYGLSQLHQLRGRVGRGPKQSYCFLFPSPNITENGKKRLQTIKNTIDGFEIADTDLKMRGGGIISGLEQSGYLDFKLCTPQDHPTTFKTAQNDAQKILHSPETHTPFIKDLLSTTHEKLKGINFS